VGVLEMVQRVLGVHAPAAEVAPQPGLTMLDAAQLPARAASFSPSMPAARGARVGAVSVTSDTALRHSAVWACLQLRANLVASTPVDVFRRIGGVQVEMPRPPLFEAPGGGRVGLPEWLFSSQVDIDRVGNFIGLITERDGQGLPRVVEMHPASVCQVLGKGPQITGYRIAGRRYDPEQVWHEKGFTLPGIPVGLSAVAYGAWSIGGYLSAQQYALDWFAVGPHPKGQLKNVQQDIIGATAIAEAKAAFKAATENGDLFVHGKNWEYTPEEQQSAGAVFLEEMRYGAADVCRFFGVPADMIDAGTSGSSITYANVTQRNLQFLIMHLGPAFVRREWAFSTWAMPRPRYAKFNTDALLRMDPQTRAQVLGQQVRDRLRAPSEARELDNLQPFTDEQLAEFDRLFGPPKAATPAAAVPALPGQQG